MAQHIFIIEDDPNTVFLFETILKRAGFTTASVGDGDDAIRYLEQHTPDAVLLDLGLPGANGLVVTEFIRQTPRLAQCRIVIISAYTDLIRKARQYQADVYLTKPVSAKDLVETLHRVL